MSCAHAESCVTCLREELSRVTAERDRLYAALELSANHGKLMIAELMKCQRFPEPPSPVLPAVTPPDSPSRLSKASQPRQMDELLRDAAGAATEAPRVKSFAALRAEALKSLEDPATQVENLDPQLSAPRPGPVEGPVGDPKPTVAYDNPWKDALRMGKAYPVILNAMLEQAERSRAEEKKGEPKPETQKDPKKKKARAGKKPAITAPEGISRAAKKSRGSPKEVKGLKR